MNALDSANAEKQRINSKILHPLDADLSTAVLEKPAQRMAELHVANIRSWRQDKYASQSFDAGDMDLLESYLRRIASGMENAGIVLNTARQIIAQS
ncbi:MAG TPA: hypothetical protein VE860_22195 [Chthoniobacterales bacterium]|jgi:hypothetical protein|nr:hypothetical protein [Chthoniobacterales bacterium]